MCVSSFVLLFVHSHCNELRIWYVCPHVCLLVCAFLLQFYTFVLKANTMTCQCWTCILETKTMLKTTNTCIFTITKFILRTNIFNQVQVTSIQKPYIYMCIYTVFLLLVYNMLYIWYIWYIYDVVYIVTIVRILYI